MDSRNLFIVCDSAHVSIWNGTAHPDSEPRRVFQVRLLVATANRSASLHATPRLQARVNNAESNNAKKSLLKETHCKYYLKMY